MDEKQGFSGRLKQALRDAGVGMRSPTRIAVQFNLRHHGSLVSTQGVRKWLEAGSIPKPDKIRTLGRWLKVSSEWLRYGGAIDGRPKKRKEMVCEIVEALLKRKK